MLNTDNMSIVGLTIDYGPFGFMDRSVWPMDSIQNVLINLLYRTILLMFTIALIP